MVGRHVAWTALLLLLVLSVSVVAAPVSYTVFPYKKAGNLVLKKSDFSSKSFVLKKASGKASGKAISKITGKAIAPFSGKYDSEDEWNEERMRELCEDPRFACGSSGFGEDFRFGEGDVIHYSPFATADLPLSAPSVSQWFYLDWPSDWRATPDNIPSPRIFHPAAVYGGQVPLFGPCLTARMEFMSIGGFDSNYDNLYSSYSAQEAIGVTRDVIAVCDRHEAVKYKASCFYGANQWWSNWKELNPVYPRNAELLGTTVGYFGERAWCDLKLSLEGEPVVEVDNARGNARVSWNTSIKAGVELELTNRDTEEVEVIAYDGLGNRQRNYLITSLEPGNYSLVVTAFLPDETRYELLMHRVVDQRVASSPVEFTVRDVRRPSRVEIVFVPPTPANNSVVGNSFTVAVHSAVPLPYAELHIFSLDGEEPVATTFEMNGEETEFSYTVVDLDAGSYAFAVSSGSSVSEVREVTVLPPTPPVLTYVGATPSNGAVVADTRVIVEIVSDQALESATLHWNNGATIDYAMGEVTPTRFTYTLLGLSEGAYSFSVSAVDAEGEVGTAPVRIVTVDLVTPPELTFIAPTPVDGEVLPEGTSSVTVSISSNEDLSSAILTWDSVEYPMSGSGSEFSYAVSDLGPGVYSYSVSAVDVEGDSGASESRSVTIPERTPTPPVITFVSPTPGNGVVLPAGTTEVTVAVSSSEDLSTATLSWNGVDFAMSSSGSEFSYVVSDLGPGAYSFSVSAVDVQGDAGSTSTRSVTIPERTATLPVLTFVNPTPENDAVLLTDSVTIRVSSNEPLSSSRLRLTPPVGAVRVIDMSSISSTVFEASVSNLRAGVHSYVVEVVDEEGDAASTPRRSFNAPLPTPVFDSPTPGDGAVLASDSVTIRVSSNEALDSATLRLTRPDSSRLVRAMTRVDASTFTLTLTGLRAGVNSYFVDVTDDEGDSATTETRLFTVPSASVVFVAPTPDNGAVLPSNTAEVTISVSSSEPLSGATLIWAASPPQEFAMTRVSDTLFTYTISVMAGAVYTYSVSVRDLQGDAATSETRSLAVESRVPTPPVIAFVGSTPVDGASQESSSASIAVLSDVALASASLHWTYPDESSEIFAMNGEGMEFSFDLIGLVVGDHSYFVEGVDGEGDAGLSETRALTVTARVPTLPVLTFIAPTPDNGAVLPEGTTEVSVAVSSNEDLSSATLTWNGVEYVMSGSGSEFSYTASDLGPGAYSFSVSAVDVQGDAGTSGSRSVTIPERTPTPPVITITAPVFVSGEWWDSAWGYRREVTLSSSVSSTLTDFPAQFVFDTASLVSSGRMNADCSDLRVLDSDDATLLSFEVERSTCNTGSTVVWVKVPSLGATHVVYAYYGNDAASDGQGIKDVWSNNFASVFHFGGDALDSLERNNGTATGVTYPVSRFGFGANFDSSIQSRIDLASATNFPSGSADRAVSVWRSGAFGNSRTILSYGDGGSGSCWVALVTPGLLALDTNGGPGASFAYSVPVESTHLVFEHDSGNFEAFASGVNYGSSAVAFTSASANAAIGYRFCGNRNDVHHQGVLDELRVHVVARSADWYAAENAQSAVVGAEEERPSGDSGALTDDSVTVSISSDVSLASATAVVTSQAGETRSVLSLVSPTEFSSLLTGLRAGLNSLVVEGVDEEGDVGTSSVVEFTVPSPVASFVAPTPGDAASLEVTEVTISIEAGEPLASATLSWSGVDFAMSETDSTHFLYIVAVSPGDYSYSVSFVDDEGDSGVTETRTLTVTARVPTPPVIAFVAPTPDNAASLEDVVEVTVSIEAGEALSTATLTWNGVDFAMSETDSTHFSYTVTSIVPGDYSYSVSAVDLEGDAGTSETRSLSITPRAVTPPVLSFVAPTPGNGEVLPEGTTEVSVAVSSNEDLSSATLSWNGVDFAMSGSGAEFSYTVSDLGPGAYSFSVSAVDVQGDAGASESRGVTIPERTATPPVLTFVDPSPVGGSTLVNDEATVSFTSDVDLSSATVTVTDSRGSTAPYAMTEVSRREFTLSFADLFNGTNTFAVDVVDVEGDAGSAELSVVVPITFELHEFTDGVFGAEAISSMAVFNGFLYVGTYNDSFPGMGGVYRTNDGVSWMRVFNADQSNWVNGSTTVNGVYSMAVYDVGDGLGPALFVGTGTTLNRVPDGDVYRTRTGLSWTRVFHGGEDQRINRLKVIDGTLYAVTLERFGAGLVRWYNSTNRFIDDYTPMRGELRSIEEYNEILYCGSGGGSLYRCMTGEELPREGAYDLLVYGGVLYGGTLSPSGDTLRRSTDPETGWEVENIPGSFSLLNLKVLEDGNLYLPVTRLQNAALWRKTPAGVNELVATFGTLDRTMDVVDFNGRMYTAVVERVDLSTTNLRGFLYKLTN